MKWQDCLLNIARPLVKYLGARHFPFTKKKVTGKNYFNWRNDIEIGTVFLTTTQGEFSNLINPVGIKHGAIYVGYQYIEEHHKSLPCVLEALGRGVVLTDLVTFLTSKDYVIGLKPCFMDEKGKDKLDRKAKMYLGVPYDYNFVKSVKALYCFELVVMMLKNVNSQRNFQSTKYLGREVYDSNTFLNDNRFEIIFTNMPEYAGVKCPDQ